MSLSMGILVIGSLAWSEKGGRPRWRTKRLKDSGKVFCKVRAPIRYGRLSSHNTYTMVFADMLTDPLGHAEIFPCNDSTSNFEDLQEEARWLWAAERNKADLPEQNFKAVSADWGCVALLLNPKLTDEKFKLAQSLLADWEKSVSQEQCYYMDAEARLVTKPGGPPRRAVGPLVRAGGQLDIVWPDSEGGEELPDLLLATTNTPCLAEGGRPAYPAPDQIVARWQEEARITKGVGEAHQVNYFWRNYHSGFRTFQDEEIKQRLNALGPPLSDPGP
jgi:hypothetical protein